MPQSVVHQQARAALVVPVRYAAWISGDIGRSIEVSLRRHLAELKDLETSRLPRGILVSTVTPASRALEALVRAVRIVEDEVARAYPVLHHDLGPIWNSTIHVVYPVDEPGIPVRRDEGQEVSWG